MLVKKQVEIPAKKVDVIDFIKCELCDNQNPGRDSWETRQYDVSEVTIEYRHGYHYPEGSSTTSIIIDLCPECFTNKLLPWLRAQGGEERITDNDY